MQKIREVLLHEYIGAIAIGFMLAQAAASLIAALMQPLIFYLETRKSDFGLFGREPHFSWERSAPSLVTAVLLLLVSYLLVRWLYFAKEPVVPEEKDQDEPVEEAGENA